MKFQRIKDPLLDIPELESPPVSPENSDSDFDDDSDFDLRSLQSGAECENTCHLEFGELAERIQMEEIRGKEYYGCTIQGTSLYMDRFPKKPSEVFRHCNVTLDEIFSPVFEIMKNGKPTGMVIKFFDEKISFMKETSALFSLSGTSGIPTIHIAYQSDDTMYVVMEKCPGIDSHEYTVKNYCFSEKEIRPIIKQLLTTLSVVHRNDIIHKDIKPENIIYDEETNTIKLIDYEGKTTSGFRAPELIEHNTHTKLTDMWAVGVTIYVLMCGSLPFDDTKNITTQKLKLPNKWSESFKNFMRNILMKNPLFRWSVDDALSQKWLNKN